MDFTRYNKILPTDFLGDLSKVVGVEVTQLPPKSLIPAGARFILKNGTEIQEYYKGNDGEYHLLGGGGATDAGVEFQKSDTHIQWRKIGDADWIDLVALSDITGAPGSPGSPGSPGADGQDIHHVSFTSTTGTGQGQAGQTDTYTIWGDAGATINLGTFVVHNGANGSSGTNGTNGTNGQGYTSRGAWVSGHNYATFDIVTDDGSTYECYLAITGSTTHPASDATHFRLWASKGDPGSVGIINLDDLADVDTTGVANGQTIIWQSSSNLWIPGTSSGGGLSFDDSEAQTYFAAMSAPLSSGQKTLISALVVAIKTALKTNNLASRLDLFYLFANETAESALRNLVKRSYDCTNINSMGYTQWQGMAGNGTNSYLDTGWKPKTNGVTYSEAECTGLLYIRGGSGIDSIKRTAGNSF